MRIDLRNITVLHGMRVVWVLSLAVTVTASAPAIARAQSVNPPPDAAAQRSDAQQEQAAAPGGAKRFLRDVGADYVHFVSRETATWVAAGGILSAGVSLGDDALRMKTEEPSPTLDAVSDAGSSYGNLTLQVPLAIVWWVVGHAAGSTRGADAGRDLLRAQISAASWTYAIKYAVDRTRPNGDPRSFPSGHAAATFATAMVLQEHYGWKLGVPMFTAAGLTAYSRITENKHWASDVAFGAVVGMAAGRTVTIHLRSTRMAIAPLPVPGGAGVVIHALP